jgi:hypothetical protein
MRSRRPHIGCMGPEGRCHRCPERTGEDCREGWQSMGTHGHAESAQGTTGKLQDSPGHEDCGQHPQERDGKEYVIRSLLYVKQFANEVSQ